MCRTAAATTPARCWARRLPRCTESSFRDAPLGAGPESITPDRGYGFRARAKGAPRNDGLGLHAAPVDRLHDELRKLDAVDAADVERHHLAAVRLFAAGKHLDAAVDAHQ